MIKTVWLVMAIMHGIPIQQSGEHTREECEALVVQHAMQAHDATHVGDEWYCQPAKRWEPIQ